MSITYGFYDSVNRDRRYNARQLSSIFDGVINDGVFATIGDSMIVKASGSDMTVTVGTGRAWFNHTWTLNDSVLQLSIPDSEYSLDRIDAVVIDVNLGERTNDIIVVKGTPSSNPLLPVLESNNNRRQYPLCYVRVNAGALHIDQESVTNLVGTSNCPFVTGVLETITTDKLVSQWQAQWKRWFDTSTLRNEAEWEEWFTEITAQLNDQKVQNQVAFEKWFADLQTVLDGDVATNLAEQIVELQSKFDTLEKDRCIYSTITDYPSGDQITDTDDTPLLSVTIY